MYDIYYLYFKLHRPLILILNNNIDLFLEIKYLDKKEVVTKALYDSSSSSYNNDVNIIKTSIDEKLDIAL